MRSSLKYFVPIFFVEVNSENLKKKAESILCYKSQLSRVRDTTLTQTSLRARRVLEGDSGKELAEAFEVYTMQWGEA